MEGGKLPRDCKQSLRPYRNREAKRLPYNQLAHDLVGEGLAPPVLAQRNKIALAPFGTRAKLILPFRLLSSVCRLVFDKQLRELT